MIDLNSLVQNRIYTLVWKSSGVSWTINLMYDGNEVLEYDTYNTFEEKWVPVRDEVLRLVDSHNTSDYSYCGESASISLELTDRELITDSMNNRKMSKLISYINTILKDLHESDDSGEHEPTLMDYEIREIREILG